LKNIAGNEVSIFLFRLLRVIERLAFGAGVNLPRAQDSFGHKRVYRASRTLVLFWRARSTTLQLFEIAAACLIGSGGGFHEFAGSN